MSDAVPTPPHVQQVRQYLLDTLVDLRNRENPMDPARAKAIAEVAGVLVDTAKVEVEYLKVTKQDRSGFLEEPPHPAVAHLGHTPNSGYTQGTVERLPNGVTRHTMGG